MRGIALLLGFVTLCSFQTAQKQQTFYDYKGAGKTLTRLSALLVNSEPGFTFGFQSYANHEIVSSTSFYNSPSDVLHYILTTKTNRTLHFQVPVLETTSMIVSENGPNGNPVLEVSCTPETGVKVKEHNEKGGIVFSLKFTNYQIPLAVGADTKMIQKRCQQLLKKVYKYKG
ncbi:MAG: hypothetical protein JJ975_08130 [Bacteroidia bacterium]|nr:hypothetical protein [Bacteroidia bacterium]